MLVDHNNDSTGMGERREIERHTPVSSHSASYTGAPAKAVGNRRGLGDGRRQNRRTDGGRSTRKTLYTETVPMSRAPGTASLPAS